MTDGEVDAGQARNNCIGLLDYAPIKITAWIGQGINPYNMGSMDLIEFYPRSRPYSWSQRAM